MWRRRWWGALFFLCCASGQLAAQERMTIWLTFDAAKIGPAVACDGQFRLEGGGRLVLKEWLHDGNDSVDGDRFRLSTEYDARSAAAAKQVVVRRSALPKGLLLEAEAGQGASLVASTKLGNFELPLNDLRKRRTVAVLDGKAQVQWIPNASALTGNQAEEEYPAIAVLPSGQTAVAYVAWDGKADSIYLRQGERTERLTSQPGNFMEPRCAVDGRGRLWVVWTASDGKQWDLWAYCEGKQFRLTQGPRNHFWPRLARDRHGNLWLAWQTVADDLRYEIMLGQVQTSGLAGVTNVSEHEASDWEPAICTTADGRVVVAWDTYRNGSYDIYLREFAAEADGRIRPLGPPKPVAASALREAHASVAADAKNRVWIAWDVSLEDWGKHPQRGTLHSDRKTDMACYAQGRFYRPGADFMQSLPPQYAGFVEYPQVAVDAEDRLWVIFRVENQITPVYLPPKVQRAQRYGMWLLFARQFDGERWSTPVPLAQSNGRQDMRVDVAAGPGGLHVVYGADGRTRRLPYVPVDYDIFLASLGGFGTPLAAYQLTEAGDLGRITPAKPDPEMQPLPRQWQVGGKTYRLLLGDTHRHTDISRCSNGYDGSLQDAYRYALDACGLDWLAISDHDQDILKHRNDRDSRPRQDYDWWRSQKYGDVYTIPGRFVALYGYEHGGSYQQRGGHKNVIAALRGLPVQEVDAPHELFAALADSGAIVIPHQLADGGSRADWSQWNGQFERVGEIFQARGSYEFEGCPRAASIFTGGFSMWDALAKGTRIGIIASSDHGQTHQARAGTYVEEFTRQGILDGLRARRTFGATTAAALQARIGQNPLGSEINLGEPPKLEVRVVAPAEIAQVDVVCDGRFLYTKQPKARETSFEFQDSGLKPGQSAYYYVRAQIGTNDFAWSSPIWVTRSK